MHIYTLRPRTAATDSIAANLCCGLNCGKYVFFSPACPADHEPRRPFPGHRIKRGRGVIPVTCSFVADALFIRIPGDTFVGPNVAVFVDEPLRLGLIDRVEMVAQDIRPEAVDRGRINGLLPRREDIESDFLIPPHIGVVVGKSVSFALTDRIEVAVKALRMESINRHRVGSMGIRESTVSYPFIHPRPDRILEKLFLLRCINRIEMALIGPGPKPMYADR